MKIEYELKFDYQMFMLLYFGNFSYPKGLFLCMNKEGWRRFFWSRIKMKKYVNIAIRLDFE